MSRRGANKPRVALDALEKAVAAALSEIQSLKDQLASSQAKNATAEAVLQKSTQNEGASLDLMDHLGVLQTENDDFRARLEQGREAVDRLLAKIRFLEEQR